jgi:hypothetical protein
VFYFLMNKIAFPTHLSLFWRLRCFSHVFNVPRNKDVSVLCQSFDGQIFQFCATVSADQRFQCCATVSVSQMFQCCATVSDDQMFQSCTTVCADQMFQPCATFCADRIFRPMQRFPDIKIKVLFIPE